MMSLIGCRCMCVWQSGGLYPGVITAEEAGRFSVEFDDGDMDPKVKPEHIKLVSAPADVLQASVVTLAQGRSSLDAVKGFIHVFGFTVHVLTICLLIGKPMYKLVNPEFTVSLHQL